VQDPQNMLAGPWNAPLPLQGMARGTPGDDVVNAIGALNQALRRAEQAGWKVSLSLSEGSLLTVCPSVKGTVSREVF
jgi:hypothetical protein